MIIASILDSAFISTFALSAVLFGSWFSFWYKSNLARTEKERAYVCTLLSSSVTSLCSIPLVYTLLTNGGDLADIAAYRTWTVIATTFFMTFLVVDLVIGVVFYRSKIDMLTGWIHHITYLLVLSWGIHNQLTAVFIMMCSLEVPTFILALGSVRSELRRDYVFAATFLTTRIIFHAYAIKCAWQYTAGFIKQQIRLAAKRKQDSVASNQAQRQRSKQQHIQPSIVSTATISSETTIKKTTISRNNKTTSASTYLSSPTPQFHQSPPVSVH
ncbi:hypothetical protein [Parasitella parasitica]|uniref:TLC domain-containing protein n=1 Tax=Parasitella parasitica TaxID=35722 RepID=A0A0B7NC70_9FUNG|nr:hypothetical protein [Parasitella parasitica]